MKNLFISPSMSRRNEYSKEDSTMVGNMNLRRNNNNNENNNVFDNEKEAIINELLGMMLGMSSDIDINANDILGYHNNRAVETTEKESFVLDTAKVSYKPWVYETAVKYNDFDYFIVIDGADTIEEAKKNHEKWLKILNSGVDTITDYETEEEIKIKNI